MRKKYHLRVKKTSDGNYWLCALIHIGYKQGSYYDFLKKYKSKAEAELAKRLMKLKTEVLA